MHLKIAMLLANSHHFIYMIWTVRLLTNEIFSGITNAEYIAGDAMQEVQELVAKLSPYYNRDVVAILDPPRAGCS